MKQVYIIQNSDKYIVSLLSLDILGAFDIVMPLRLLDILYKKSIPKQIIQQVRSFLSKRQTIISIFRYQLVLYQILDRASQESLLFLILFLFYNTKLISLCLGLRTIAISFINNTNILAYRKSIATMYRALEEAHACCLL